MKYKTVQFYTLSFLSLVAFNPELPAQAQGMFHKIEPQFSGGKPQGRPTLVPIDSNKKYGLTYPQRGGTYQIGMYLPVDPSPATAGSSNLANYYLVDDQGVARLIAVEGGFRCGNDLHRVNLPSNEIHGIKLPETSGNGEVIAPGNYALVISRGSNGYGQSARAITGDIIARSEKFNIMSNNPRYKPARFSGLVSLAPFNPKYKLPSNARDEFFNRILTIFLTSEDGNSQVRINPNSSGRFDALVPPGSYVLQSRIGISGLDRHTFFCKKSLYLKPTEEEKVTFKAGESYLMNFNLKDNSAENDSIDSHLSYTIQPGELQTVYRAGK